MESRDADEELQPELERVKVLLIEDSRVDVDLIEGLLNGAKHTCFEMISVAGIEEAGKLVDSIDSDVVLLDLSLLNVGDLESLTATSSWCCNIPIIVLTSQSDEDLGMNALRLGAQDYLVKGEIDIKDLERSIRYAIERRKGIQALRESQERYRSMFHNSHAVMLFVDFQTLEIIDANQAASDYYGYSHEDLKTMSIHDLNTLPRAELRREIRRARIMGKRRFIFRHRLADYRIRDVEVFITLIEIDGKKMLHMIIHDITEHLLEEKIRLDAYSQIERNIERFATLIDEIRNPAFIIIELASRRDDELSIKIVRQAEHIESMVQQLDEGWLESEKVRDLLKKSNVA